MYPDPFLDIDSKFTRPDLTAVSLTDWLRSKEVEDIQRLAPQPPTPKPAVGWRLGHITGFPD
jgi:hypothetical protein